MLKQEESEGVSKCVLKQEENENGSMCVNAGGMCGRRKGRVEATLLKQAESEGGSRCAGGK